MRTFISLREAAESFNVSPRTIASWVARAENNGLLESGALGAAGRKWLIEPALFRIWLQEQARQRIEARGRRPRRRKAGAR